MGVIIKDIKGNPVIEIGDYIVQKPIIDGNPHPYGGHWINRADEPAAGEGFFCKADKLVDLLNKFYEKEF